MTSKLDLNNMAPGTRSGASRPVLSAVTTYSVGSTPYLAFHLSNGSTPQVDLNQLVAGALSNTSNIVQNAVNLATADIVLINPQSHGLALTVGDVRPNNNGTYTMRHSDGTDRVVHPPLWR